MSRYFPPIDDDIRCHCQDAYSFIRHHYGWEHDIRWYPGNATGPACSYPSPMGRSYEERGIVADVIEGLIQVGYRAVDMAVERTIASGSRPDLVVEPATGPVLVWEAKRGNPIAKDRRQATRYRDVARGVWPDRDVRVFLVYPTSRTGRVARLVIEEVA